MNDDWTKCSWKIGSTIAFRSSTAPVDVGLIISEPRVNEDDLGRHYKMVSCFVLTDAGRVEFWSYPLFLLEARIL